MQKGEKNKDQNYQQMDELIQRGQLNEAKRLFLEWIDSPLERKQKMEAAEIARRLSLPEWGVKILHPIVRPSEKKPIEATSREKTEYAANLMRIGLVREARTLLTDQSSKTSPSIRSQNTFFLGLLEMREWNYDAAILHFKNLIEHSRTDHEITPYRLLLANLNLAFSMIWCDQHLEATEILQKLQEQTKNTSFRLIYINTHELMASALLGLKRYDSALKQILAARELYGPNDDTFDSLLIERTRLCIHLAAGLENPKAVKKEFERIAVVAREKHFYDLYRDLDFKWGFYADDSKALRKVYSESPFPFLKKKIEGLGKINLSVPFETSRIHLDAILDPTSLTFRLMQALAMDSYRPATIGSLFSNLFVDELFFPRSSRMRVHQVLFRLRKQLSDAGLAKKIRILERKSRFWVEVESGRSLHFSSAIAPSKKAAQHQQLLAALQTLDSAGVGVSVKTLSEYFDLPLRSIQHRVKMAKEDGVVEVRGAARATLIFALSF